MTLGLFVGGGDIPKLIAEHTKQSGDPIHLVVCKGYESDWMLGYSHEVCGLTEFGKQVRSLKKNGCDKLCIIGNVKRPDFSNLKPDMKGLKVLPKILKAAKKGDDSLLRAVVNIFESEGIQVIGAHEVLSDLTLDAGIIGQVVPAPDDVEDITKAYEIAGEIGALDIGQGAVVCSGLVLAVEAQEGTDEMLKRVARLPDNIRGDENERRGALVKRPKPMQETRVDLPTLGVDTIRNAAAAGLKTVAVVEKSALWVNIEEMRSLADTLGVALVSLKSDGSLP